MTIRMAAPLAAIVALVPGTAHAAPTLAPLKACYVSVKKDPKTQETETERVTLSGSGFTPSSLVDIRIDEVTVASGVPIDAAGNLPPGYISAPYVKDGQRDFSVTVVEQANPAQIVTLPTKVVALKLSAKPRKARPSSRITLTGSGFTDGGKTVWAHYVKNRRHKKTVKLGKPTGPCGLFKVKVKQFPFNPSTGTWFLQADQQKKYSARPASVYITLKIDVLRVLRRGR